MRKIDFSMWSGDIVTLLVDMLPADIIRFDVVVARFRYDDFYYDCHKEKNKKGSCIFTATLFTLQQNRCLAFDHLPPLRANFIAQLWRRLGHRREVLHPFERTASIDNGA